jgi:hypothetical protein
MVVEIPCYFISTLKYNNVYCNIIPKSWLSNYKDNIINFDDIFIYEFTTQYNKCINYCVLVTKNMQEYNLKSNCKLVHTTPSYFEIHYHFYKPELLSLEKVLDNKNKELEKIIKELKYDKIVQLESDNKNYKNTIKVLENKNIEKEKIIQELKYDKIVQLESDNKNYKNTIKVLENQNIEKENIIKELKYDKIVINLEYEEKEREIKELVIEHLKIKKDNDELKNKNNEYLTIINNKDNLINELKYDNLIMNIGCYINLINKLKNKNKRKSKKYNKYIVTQKILIDNLQQNLDNNEIVIDNLQNTIELLKINNSEDYDDNIITLEYEYSLLANENKICYEEIEKYEETISQLQQKINSITNLNTRLINTLSKKENNNKIIKYDYAEIKSKNQKLNNEFKRIYKLIAKK